MHHLFLINEGTAAVITMSVALFIAFGMVIALGAYVIYCDRLNRAGEAALAHAGDAEGEAVGGADEHTTTTSAASAGEPAHPARRRRAEPPPGH